MRAGQETGIALLGVLWVLALLCVAAAGMSASVRGDTALTANLVALAQARHAAEAGVNLALFELTARESPAGWLPDGAMHELGLGNVAVRVTAADETGKIDLNAAPPGLLDGLLRSAGAGEEERLRIVDAILDWRDPDSIARPNGAEAAQYRAAGMAYGAKNAPFDSVEELQLVLGVSPELYRIVAPALTVHSRQPGIIAESATRQVLMAIPGAQSEEVDGYLALRERHREKGAAPPVPPAALRQHLTRTGTAMLGIHAEARSQNGARAHIRATVDLRRPGEDAPFTFREWRQDGPELFTPAS